MRFLNSVWFDQPSLLFYIISTSLERVEFIATCLPVLIPVTKMYF